MAKPSEHSSTGLVKALVIGPSGCGKTGALESLVRAGYDLRIIDFDNGFETLFEYVKSKCPDRLDSIEFQSYRDRMKMTQQGPKPVGTPTAYVDAMRALEKWPDDESDPSAWGPKRIAVVDSLTNAGRAAFLWARAMNPTAREPRQWYFQAQQIIEDLVANLTDDSFNTNVLVLTHMDVYETPEGISKAFASSIGKALGPKLPRFFNNMVAFETKGFGANAKRRLKTLPTSMLDLKTSAPIKVKAEYEIDDGMAELFKDLRK